MRDGRRSKQATRAQTRGYLLLGLGLGLAMTTTTSWDTDGREGEREGGGEAG